MMKSISLNIIQKLIDLKILSYRDIIDGSSIVATGRQRNRFFYFKKPGGPSFFIKEAHEGEAGAKDSIALEGKIYTLVSEAPILATLKSAMPRFFHFDAACSTLIIELIEGAEDIGTLSRRIGHLPPGAIERMSKALALCHDLPVTLFEDAGIAFEKRPHWIFRLLDDPSPLPYLRNRSKGSAEFIDAVLGFSPLVDHITHLRSNWAALTLTHGDVKLENFLFVPAQGDQDSSEVKIIDWERADVADPTWDIGCGMAAFCINKAIMAAQSSQSLAADVLCQGDVIEQIEAFWAAYRIHRHPGMRDEHAFLERSLGMMAARLLVAGYEGCYGLEHISPLSNCLLDLAKHWIGPLKSSVLLKLTSPLEKAVA